jgi:hypothetical protein
MPDCLKTRRDWRNGKERRDQESEADTAHERPLGMEGQVKIHCHSSVLSCFCRNVSTPRSPDVGEPLRKRKRLMSYGESRTRFGVIVNDTDVPETVALGGWLSIASSAIACSGTARRLASVFVHFDRPL